MGKLMFVCDNRNQVSKLENFGGKCFPFSRKEKQDDCFFLNKRNLLERELSYSIFGEEKIRTESKPRNMVRKSFSKRRTIFKAME